MQNLELYRFSDFRFWQIDWYTSFLQSGMKLIEKVKP